MRSSVDCCNLATRVRGMLDSLFREGVTTDETQQFKISKFNLNSDGLGSK